jgi:hypothetical protein
MLDLRRREFITVLGGAPRHGRSQCARSRVSGCGASGYSCPEWALARDYCTFGN